MSKLPDSSHKGQPRTYRADIDGLRAFAVLSVVFFHAFPQTLKGGFIGVDVFFVISGYLICGIILRDLQVGAFSFANFYARRIRRIFPALIVVMGTIVVAGWFVLLPDEYTNLGKHIFGGTLFLSNFVLWSETGYFDVAARAKPLLHLWSLGIEEQYYILFPIFLWFCAKKNIQAVFGIIVLFFISFFDNIYLHRISPVIDFYSPLSRIWELLLGASLAAIFRHSSVLVAYLKIDALCSGFVYVGPQKNDGRCLSLILAVTGSVLLGLGLLLARESNPYPGWIALLPTMGAALLIAAGPLNPISNYLLSNRISVFIGKISYPLYLWHWALISFAFIVTGSLDSSTLVLRICLVVASFVLSILTYFFVEKKIRYSDHNKATPVALLCAMLCIASLGGIIKSKNGFIFRVGSEDSSQVNAIEIESKRALKKCIELFPDWETLNDNMCKIQSSLDRTTIALIGDSHAGHLFDGLAAFLSTKDSLAVFPASCAAPYIDVSSGSRAAGLEFRKNGTFLINRSIDDIVKNENIKNVILSHNPECSYNDIIDVRNESIVDRDKILENGMRRTFDVLTNAKKNIIVVVDSPHPPFQPSSCKNRPYGFFSEYNQCKFKRTINDANISRNWYKKILYNVIVDYKNVKVVDLTGTFCDGQFCYAKKDGHILYRDVSHLSVYGSLLAAPAIMKALE